MIQYDAKEEFEALVKRELGVLPEGSKLEVVRDSSKQPDTERDHYICTLTDCQGAVIGKWSAVEKQKMYAPVPSFSISRLAAN